MNLIQGLVLKVLDNLLGLKKFEEIEREDEKKIQEEEKRFKEGEKKIQKCRESAMRIQGIPDREEFKPAFSSLGQVEKKERLNYE